MLVIGSRAVIRFGMILRTPKDWDVICTYDEYEAWCRDSKQLIVSAIPQDGGKKTVAHLKDGSIWEFEIAWLGTTAHSLLELVKSDPESVHIEGWYYPSLDVLYTIKMSHRYLKNSPHFLKTMKDILIMRIHGAKIPDGYKDWLKEREKATYTYSHPKLNVKKAQFFNGDQVNYVYDHDTIHMAMSAPNAPAYTLFKEDQAEVKCSKDKFFELPYEARLASVREEAEVLALERSQIPFKGQIHPRDSFMRALEKVCTSISSGWWREFAWENYTAVMARYRPEYVDIFEKGVASGLVKKL